jgi:hypothetical protein
MAEKRILTIERAKWRRGGDTNAAIDAHGPTLLHNQRGLMCCLGFDALACGVPLAVITGIGEPSDIPDVDRFEAYVTPERFRRLDGNRLKQSDEIMAAIKANDDPAEIEPVREARVRAALLALGWDDVVFV